MKNPFEEKIFWYVFKFLILIQITTILIITIILKIQLIIAIIIIVIITFVTLQVELYFILYQDVQLNEFSRMFWTEH